MARPDSEAERIARFVAAFASGGAGVVAGPGDDNAVTRPRPGQLLVTKVDQVVEGVHFTDAFRPEEIGHKALAVALSDLAAGGAEPRWFLVAIALPKGHPRRHLDGVARGMSRLARRSRIALVGGNFTAARELSIAVTAIGEAKRPLLRRGGRPGDVVAVSGTLGGAALGRRELSRGRPVRPSVAARRQLAPEPRLALGRIAGRFASAAVDVSDGLLRDLGHLCERSGVGAELELEALPLALGLKGHPAGEALALAGGEDYELIVAVPAARYPSLERAARKAGEPLTAIGHLTRRRGVRLLRGGDPRPTPPHTGFDHFARRR